MTSENSATIEHLKKSASHGGCRNKWSAMNITVMVLGFILFWPVGLVVLFWILSGRQVRDLPEAIREKWVQLSGRSGGQYDAPGDNVVFNEYQQTQYDRISEIKAEIKDRARRFQAFRASAKRRADEEEFNQFMASSPSRES